MILPLMVYGSVGFVAGVVCGVIAAEKHGVTCADLKALGYGVVEKIKTPKNVIVVPSNARRIFATV